MARKRRELLDVGKGKGYFDRVHWPLQSLVFISPLLLFYQIMSFVMPAEVGNVPSQLVAFTMLRQFFAFFGAFGNVLPLLAVVAILLFWHLARKDPWEFDPPLYAGMAAESVIWGVPFVVIGMAIWRHLPAASGVIAAGSGGSWQARAILSVGAGIYEELLFRLIAINLLSMLFMDLCKMKGGLGIPLIVVFSGLFFSLYHFLGSESFTAALFLYRWALGAYLAGIYLYRGYGIAVGAHAVYDLILVIFSIGG